MYKLTIDGRLPSCNEYIKACRGNKYNGASMKKVTQFKIKNCIKNQIPNVHIYGRALIHFTWYEKNARRDVDNVCFAKKFILDALVECEVIPNDSQKYVGGFTDDLFIDSKNPRVEVEIEEY